MKYLAVVFLLAVSACSDSSTAHRAVASQGFTNIVITGYSLFGCGDKDTFRTGFTAIGADGKAVKGVVCSGWLKGATVRVW